MKLTREERSPRSRSVTESWGCLSVAELAGIRAGKLATATKPRSELSARGYLELVAGWVGSECGLRPRRWKPPGAFLQVPAIDCFPQGATAGQGGRAVGRYSLRAH